MRAKFNIKAQFSINKPQIPAVFKINAAGVDWGSIRGNIENQIDLQNALNQKANLNYVENEFITIDYRLESLEDTIPVLEGEINQKPNRDELSPIAFSGDYNDLNIKPIIGNGTLTLLQNGDFVGDFKANATNNKTWNIDIPTKLSQLENDIADIDVEQVNNAIERHNQSEDAHRYIQGRIVRLDDKYTVVTEMLNSEIANANDRITANANNITIVNNNLTALGQLVNENYDTLNGNILETEEQLSNDLLATSNSLNLAIEQEALTREGADNNLQSQIDSITAASDVVSIVGTYAELLQYDTATLTPDDIIKVLNDEIHENASSYYRWTGSAWVYIGSEGPFYTKSEANSTFVPQTRTINNKALTNNINLTASDVKALPDTTVIGNGNLTVQKNGVNIANFSANETTNVIANISVPTSVSELTNDANYVTSNQLETSLNTKQDKLTAGTGIEITAENVINSTAVTEWGEIQGELSNQEDLQNALNLKANISSLANVATSGNYNDLSNKPTIPTTTSQLTNDSGFITDVNLTPLRSDITSLQNNKQNKLTAGNNIVIENDVISAEVEVQGGEKYGIKGDYSTHYGIEYCQYGLIETTVGSNTVVVKGGMVLVIPGAETKTTIASDISYTIENSTDLTLFYADGEIIEVLDVYYSLEEPTNDTEGFIAWFNPEVGLWQFKSNATGNVWRTANATPLADVKYGNGNIVRIDYIGYRILNDDIYALKSDIPDLSEIYTKSETDALLDEKQDVFSTNAPLDLSVQILSSQNNLRYTDGEVTILVDDYNYYFPFATQEITFSNFPTLGNTITYTPVFRQREIGASYSTTSSIIAELNGRVNYLSYPYIFTAGKEIIFPVNYHLGYFNDNDEFMRIIHFTFSASSSGSMYGSVLISNNGDGYLSNGTFKALSSITANNFHTNTANNWSYSLYCDELSVGSNLTVKLYDNLNNRNWSWNTILTQDNINALQKISIGLGFIYLNDSSTTYNQAPIKDGDGNILFNTDSGSFKSNTLKLSIDNQTIQVNSDGELEANLDSYALKSEIPDISNLATKTELEAKQDKLTAGENITIENNVISAVVSENAGGGMPIGKVYSLNCTDKYVPEGSLPCDGTEYAKTQFNDLWENYLASENVIPAGFSEIINIGNNTNANGIVTNPTEQITISSGIDISKGETRIYFTTGEDVTTNQIIATLNDEYAIMILNNTFYHGSGGLTTCLPNTEYNLRISSDGVVSIYTDNTLVYDNVYSSISSISGIALSYTGYTFLGSYNFAKSYYYNTNGQQLYFYSEYEIRDSLLNTCSYAQYEAELATYGQCAKFAVDTTNETFRVPKIKDGAVIQQALTNSELGKAYNAGLPNITADWKSEPSSDGHGAVYVTTESGDIQAVSAGGSADNRLYFDASLSNSIYGNSDTVQMNSVALRHFVVVANGSINQSMMDWSQWASNLQGKANVDGSNMVASVKNFDGQWFLNEVDFAVDAATTSTDTEYDLSSYLPDDGYQYEVLFSAYAMPTTTKSKYVGVILKTDVINNWVHVCMGRCQVSGVIGDASGSTTLAVGTGRKVIVMGSNASNWGGTYILTGIAYRRVGTNE